MQNKPRQRLYFIAFIAFLLTACAETKPLERCNEEFTPINVDIAVQP
jgi:hypothetical protein